MTQGEAKHVFVSYVREDAVAVDSLCAVLDAAQIPYWRDRSALGPGDAWRAKIREAIRQGALVFLACFSDNSRGKEKSYMNEEVTLAIDEYRQMPPGRTWLIPVRFDDGDVPDWDLGAGRVLSDLNFSDLFGPEHMANAARLVTTIHRLTGEKQPDPATALAAVEQASAADRTDLLRRLTKEMLPDPARRIELDDLVSQEVQRVMAVLNDTARMGRPLNGTNDEQIAELAAEARDLWDEARPFCASLQVAARWGTPDALTPWVSGLAAFVSVATRLDSGVDARLKLRHLPGVTAINTAALACSVAGTWANLRTLVSDTPVRDSRRSRQAPMLVLTGPAYPFANEWVANALARGTLQDIDFTQALSDFAERRVGKYHTPEAEWLHAALRPIFDDQVPDPNTYDEQFDRAEVMLGVLAKDSELVQRAADGPHEYTPSTYWVGRASWRSTYSHGNPLEDFQRELATQQSNWRPLQGGLFGGDVDRATAAIEGYKEMFERAAFNRG